MPKTLSPDQLNELFLNAQSFFAAGQLALANAIEMKNRPTLAVPTVVLLSFAAEPGLKALVALKNPAAMFTGSEGHEEGYLRWNRCGGLDRHRAPLP